jgi:hypothetical protein
VEFPNKYSVLVKNHEIPAANFHKPNGISTVGHGIFDNLAGIFVPPGIIRLAPRRFSDKMLHWMMLSAGAVQQTPAGFSLPAADC